MPLPIVYTIRGCDACVKLLRKWEAQGVAYEERRVELDQATLDEARQYGMMVPIVVWPDCGCCGMKIFVDNRTNVYALYRSATESVHRDIYLLTSQNQGQRFEGRLLHKWDINACPMSSMDIAENEDMVVGAW